MKKGANVNCRLDEKGFTPLMLASEGRARLRCCLDGRTGGLLSIQPACEVDGPTLSDTWWKTPM